MTPLGKWLGRSAGRPEAGMPAMLGIRRRPAFLVACAVSLAVSLALMPPAMPLSSGSASAQSRAGSEAASQSQAVNPFRQPLVVPPRKAEDASVLTQAMCEAILAKRAGGQTAQPGEEPVVEACLDQRRQQQRVQVNGIVDALGRDLQLLAAVGRSGDRILFRLGEVPYQGQVGQIVSIRGQQLRVEAEGPIVRLVLPLPPEVARDAGFIQSPVVWNGAVGMRRSLTPAGSSQTGGQAGGTQVGGGQPGGGQGGAPGLPPAR